MNPDILSQIREGGILYILLLIAVTMHEFGHAFFADKLGDPLPRLQDRVTINPLAHMDTIGTVVLPIITITLSMGTGFPMVFGWGKPVEISLSNPKTRKRIDIIATAGGVAMNLVVAFVSAMLLAAFLLLGWENMQEVALQSVYINCVLFVINMIPIPPLDGSRFLKYAVDMSEHTYYAISRYGILILLLLVNIPFTASIFMFITRAIASVFIYAALLVVKLFS